MIPEAQLGWMAAILDIQGYVIRKKNPQRVTPQLVLMVETKESAVVQRLCQMTGQQIEMRAKRGPREAFGRRRCIEHCPEQHEHVDESFQMPAIGRWTVTGASAAIVLYNVMPYLVSFDKGYQDTMVTILEQVVLTGPGSGMIKAAIRRLRSLGWELPPALEAKMAEAERSAGAVAA